ncbi:MAG TPA: peptide chain release factor 2 [Candidatus Saccharimonadia bacterium]|nr:peptide chain release factor 2 [Candidatus Saccharimonadia bacterium]
MQELIRQIEDLSGRIRDAVTRLDVASDVKRAAELEEQTLVPGFWDNPETASATSRQLAALQRHINSWMSLQSEAEEALELAQLEQHSNDEDTHAQVRALYEKTRDEFEYRQFELKLSGPHDRSSAIIEIHAGTGGTDAQDWAQMLQRMYLRWAEKAGLTSEIDSLSPGEEAGLKSVTMEINGPYAYGLLKGEGGVHRLVRLSPFNADSLRQTSFALVEVLPQIEAGPELEIDPKDLRIDVYRSGGHGGQSVNTTDSAVRITHLPTGVVVAIQNERSQLQNREKAMTILKGRIAALMEAQAKKSLTELRASDKAAEWGNQIRNYVLHPYTKVKDVRTGTETSDAQGVLDGNLEPFIESYLNSQIGPKNAG